MLSVHVTHSVMVSMMTVKKRLSMDESSNAAVASSSFLSLSPSAVNPEASRNITAPSQTLAHTGGPAAASTVPSFCSFSLRTRGRNEEKVCTASAARTCQGGQPVCGREASVSQHAVSQGNRCGVGECK